MITKKITWYGPKSEWTLNLPGKNEMCSSCKGTGTMVNPNIDGNGLSPDDPDLDEDFWHSYRTGVFDIDCNACDGEKIIQVIDEARLTKRQRIIFNDWLKQERFEAQERARDNFNRSLGIEY